MDADLPAVSSSRDAPQAAASPCHGASKTETEASASRGASPEPIMTGPLVCQLCEDVAFSYDADFATHKESVHARENEYRKRVLFLMEQSGCRLHTTMRTPLG